MYIKTICIIFVYARTYTTIFYFAYLDNGLPCSAAMRLGWDMRCNESSLSTSAIPPQNDALNAGECLAPGLER